MPRLIPVLAKDIHSGRRIPSPAEVRLWESPGFYLGAALDAFSRPAVGSLRVSSKHSFLGSPAGFIFPLQTGALPREISISDSNDVLEINLKSYPDYSELDHLDQARALGFARGILEQDSLREAMIAQVARNALLPGVPDTGKISDVVYTRDLACARIEAGPVDYQPFPAAFDLPDHTQRMLKKRLPDLAPDDTALILSQPAFDGLSSHERLHRLPTLNDQVSLLVQAMDVKDHDILAPLISGAAV